MSLLNFSILAAFVILGGLTVATSLASLLSQAWPEHQRTVGIISLGIYLIVLVWQPDAWLLGDLGVLLGAVGGILLMGKGLTSGGSLLSFLWIAALVDLLSVSGGLSRMIVDSYVKGSSDLLIYLTLALPVKGQIVPIVGISDLFIGGTVALALLRIGLSRKVVIISMASGFLAALGVGLWKGGAPALPYLAISTTIVLWLHNRGPRS